MKDVKDVAKDELSFCLDLWAKKGSCSFGGGTQCYQCGTPYLLYKLSTGQVLHGEMNRLTREDWVLLEQKLTENS